VDVAAAAALGIVQGLTEFLPVSSSGHLILARAFFGWDVGRFGLAFDVACHVGTLLAVVAYFRHEVAQLVRSAPGALTGRAGAWERLGRLIVVGTLPVVVVGLGFADAIETTLRSPAVVAGALAAGAFGLVAAERFGARQRGDETLGFAEALGIGIAQALALVPGVSRSGVTISVAMLFGLKRDAAARFVFLLSLPAVFAAAVKEGMAVADAGVAGFPVTPVVVGLLVSAVVGYVTVKYFIRYLADHSLHAFAMYRLGLAAVTLVWLASREA
jgi:undecaprenyl-diphosphatase